MRTEATKKLFTVDEYYRMGEAGILPEAVRTELINGEIIEMSAMRARHAGGIARVNDVLLPLFKLKALLRPQLPLRLNNFTEPQPDLCVVKVRGDYYASEHPSPEDTFLAIEVSDTSLSYDRDVKSKVYAEAGIPEFWIVDLVNSELLVFRGPSGGTYRTALALRHGDTVSPSTFPDISIDVADLLG
jgi:Uma2 family endonuclease